MLKFTKSLFLIILFAGCKNKDKNTDVALNSTKEWFKAWKLVSEDVFQLKNQSETRFVFFDKTYVYTTSPITGNDGEKIEGPDFLGKKQVWFKKEHKGILILPDSTKAKVDMMIYASPTKEKGVKTFFIMPLLSFWKERHINSNGIELEKLTAGIFVHEFSHATQLETFEKFNEYFETYQKKFGDEAFGDNMMQTIFEKNQEILSLYKTELYFFQKSEQSNDSHRKKMTKIALRCFYNKHEKILIKYKKDLKKLDDIWLTMEGLGQYAMYEYLINSKGGNMSKKKAFEAMKTKSWSQEEGFALFYLLSKYKKPEIWAKDFFNPDMPTIIEVLQKEVN